MEIKKKIITYLRKNKVSTTEVADCLGKSGALEGVLPINSRMYVAGEIMYSYAIEESNWTIHEAVRNSCEDKIVFIDAIDVNGRALVGELVAKYAILYQGACAIVTNGKMRDANALIKERYPIWCTGVTPVGCFNKAVNYDKFADVIERNREKYEGAILVCDDCGVVLIPKEQINEAFYQKLEDIEKQEDIWFDCIDRLKWDTYDTVCLKRYLTKEEN